MKNTYYPDTVFIFGAGVSFDAKIPLLANFIDTMSRLIHKEKTSTGKKISSDDLNILIAANDIRHKLDSYSSRVKFDNHNIEDVLSILSFKQLGDRQSIKYKTMVQAIAKTITLECSVIPRMPNNLNKHDVLNNFEDTTDLYSKFWKILFKLKQHPVILTFNYDMVLEIALWNSLFCTQDMTNPHSVNLKYSSENSLQFEQLFHSGQYDFGNEIRSMGCLIPKESKTIENSSNRVEIEYLKLHGSLNWVSEKNKIEVASPFYSQQDAPFILPPVFNKSYTSEIRQIWQRAMEVLQNAKRIIIVGYSLPQTDIYMQFFLKTAIGPNLNDVSISVFDPTLYKNNEETKQMKLRYAGCFSESMQNYIDFQPISPEKDAGTFRDFIWALEHEPEKHLY